MASRQPTRWLQALRSLRPLQQRPYHATPRLLAADGATPASPPLLATLKTDLKTAMRSKDAPRLAVLRAILAAVNNAAKTPAPVSTDTQLVALLRKSLRASREASAEARDAQRSDLADAEDVQGRIIEDYIGASGVQSVSEAQVRELVQKAVADARAAGSEGSKAMGLVMKAVTQSLKGQDVEVDSKSIKKIVDEALQG